MAAATSVMMDANYLRENLHRISPQLPLTPEQAGIILQRTTGALQDDRTAGNPPPFKKVNGSVRYILKDVLDALGPTFNNSSEAAEHERQKTLGFNTFGSFLNYGKLNDQWPFAIVSGNPVDFFASIEEGIPDESPCKWMTLGDYLTERKAWAETQPRQTQAAKLTPGTKAEQPPKAIVLGKDTL